MKEAENIIEEISEFNIPIMVGGPHATLYPEDLTSIADYIIVGEAENVIVDVVNNSKIENEAKLICSEPPDPKDLPYPDFTSFFGYENIYIYPLLTSRGCPYNCSFCAVRFVSTRKWRPRKTEDCIKEVIDAKNKLKNLDSVIIYDDNPMFRKTHMKNFLHLYIESRLACL